MVISLGWFTWVLVGLLALVTVPITLYLYVHFGGYVLASLLERQPWSRTVRGIQLGLVPVVVFLAWKLSFREFSYGLIGVMAAIGAIVWARTLLEGGAWIQSRGSRFNIEWAGPLVLAGLSVGYISSAINPWF